MSKRKDKLEVFGRPAGFKGSRTWYWHLRSSYNGKIKCSGQASGYSSKRKAIEGWEGVASAAIAGVEVVRPEHE